MRFDYVIIFLTELCVLYCNRR